MTQGLPGRAAALASAVVALLVGLTFFGFTVGRSETHGSLKVDDSGVDYCYRAPTAADRTEQATHGVTFGLDYLRLSSTSAHVRVLAVELVDPSGGLSIEKTRFVPGGGIATGTAGNKPISTANPVLATLARAMPADLALTPRPAHVGGPNDYYDPRDWQLAVTLRAPANALKASMNGLVVIYRSGKMIRALHTYVTATIGTGICKF
jgi:hypothetical protein